MSKFKQIAKNNKIVYANCFLRWGEAIWDFVDSHFIHNTLYYKIGDIRRAIRRGFQRMFHGYDETISWGHESSIKFYKKLLSDLYEHVHGCPCNLWEICPEEWKEVEDKWHKILGEDKNLKTMAFDKYFVTDEQRDEFFEDQFQTWRKYVKRVLHYFEEADCETCSLKDEKNRLYEALGNPFSDKQREVVEHNGNLYYSFKPIEDVEERKAMDAIHKRLSEIYEYEIEQLKLGMAEIAKNIVNLTD